MDHVLDIFSKKFLCMNAVVVLSTIPLTLLTVLTSHPFFWTLQILQLLIMFFDAIYIVIKIAKMKINSIHKEK